MKDIIARRKRYLHNDDVKAIHVPQYQNLTVEKILDYVRGRSRIESYLPDPPDLDKVPKAWLTSVCAAVLGDTFRGWVHDQVEVRNALMAEKKEIMISMDPQMAAKFAASTHVSSKCPIYLHPN